MWQVYILKSTSNKWYYVGSTNRLSERIKEHNSGKVRSTKHFKPLKVVYTKGFATESEARSYERRLKKNRIEKENIIRNIENQQSK